MAVIHPLTSNLNLQINTQFTHLKSETLTRSRLNFRPLIARSCLNHSNVVLFDAAKHTVDTYLQSGMVVGLGSGLASSMAIEYLGQKLRVGLLKGIVGIPTSDRIASEAEKAGIPLQLYQDSTQIDFSFNDADIMEEGSLNVVIGRQRPQGEESIIEEKKILDVTENLVIMVKEKQYKTAVEGSIPVLVNSVSWMDTAEEIDDLFVGDAEVWRRPSMGHADPTGGNFPLVTTDGHNILDVIFTTPIPNLAEVANLLNSIDGVACHGIITKTPCTAVIATESGLRIIETSNVRSV
ncbi:probable ribose-5-phosphate isomerase 4, chloroplastic isoform X1 [Helianthus annuus]|nr:probable ribose-5-phosphate isomerase 4, chloroplastic isoform X1 [Helianthus annuus]